VTTWNLAGEALLHRRGGALSSGDRIEIRGVRQLFPCFFRPPRLGRKTPKTGESVAHARASTFSTFHAGKELRVRVSAAVAPIEEND
jgi:nucleoid DNA-binding protein